MKDFLFAINAPPTLHQTTLTMSLPKVELSPFCSLYSRGSSPSQLAGIEQVYDYTHPAYCFLKPQNELVVATDVLNIRQIYYYKNDQFCLISNRCSLIQQCIATPFSLSQEAISCWLSGQPINDLALFNEIKVLPAGYALHCSSDSLNQAKYWDLSPENKLELKSDTAYAERFRHTLESAVCKFIDKHDICATQMSGGMDSTSITSIVQSYAKTHDKRNFVLSHLYKHDVASDESALIEDMKQFLNLGDHLIQDVDDAQYQDFFSLYPADFDNPGIVLSPRYDDELNLLQSKKATLLLTGNGGDEACWGHASAYTERFKHWDIGVLYEVLNACRQTNMPFFKVAYHLFAKPMVPRSIVNLGNKLRNLRPATSSLPSWLTPKGKEAAMASHEQPNPYCKRSMPTHHARYFALKNSTTFNSVRSYDEIAKKFGIQVEHPFFDRSVVELSFAVPSRQLIRGPYPKWILRNAMGKSLPESVCWRTTKTTFDSHFAGLVRKNHKQLRECLSHPMLADIGLIDNVKVLKAFDEVVHSRNTGMQVDLLFVILTQRWIQTFHAN